jgi:uncharacterized protein involved in exopolysaccharide biosynthesis
MSTLLILARRLLMGAWRYRWLAVAVSWAICGAGWAYVYTVPNSYEASARLYVDADAILTPLLRGLALENPIGQQLDVLQRTLLSRPNLEKLVSNTDLDLTVTGPADLEGLVSGLANQIHINPQTQNLFTISYRNKNPKLAFDVVQTILTTFIESKTGNNRSEMENAGLFLQQQIGEYERQLRDAEKKRAEFRAKYLDLLPAGDTGASRLDQAQENLRHLQGALTDELATRDMLSRELTATPQMVVTEANDPTGATPGSPAAIALNPRVVEAQRALDELLITRTDNHPDVVLARKHLEEIRASIAKEAAELSRETAAATAAATGVGPALSAVKPGAKGKADADSASPPLKPGAKGKADADSASPPLSPSAKGKADAGAQKPAANTHEVPNPVYEQLKVRMFETESTLSSLQRQLAEATRERDRMAEMARSAPGLQAEYINLNRDYDVLESNYKGLLGRREEMRMAQAANASADKIKMQVIDPPQVPQNPVAPKRSLMLTAVLALGVAGGAAVAVLLVQFDQSFHTIDELRDLGFPVLGGISLLNTTVTRGRLASAFAFGMALVLLGGLYLGLLYRLAHTPGIA